MPKTTKNTATVVKELIAPTVTALGIDIWDVEYLKVGSDWYLRVTIDSPAGISVDDCERVHRAIDPILDEVDPIQESYMLEVSSPGVERQIRTPEHFNACVGEVITLKTFGEVEGTKSLTGTLTAFDPETKEVTIDCGNGEISVDWKLISRANIYFNFED